ncbi:hypothetical protein Tco_1338947 [Tanacetum coccineum]
MVSTLQLHGKDSGGLTCRISSTSQPLEQVVIKMRRYSDPMGKEAVTLEKESDHNWLMQKMHDDLEYVKSLEKEVDELESEKADFSNIYDLLLEEYLKAQMQDKNIAISELKKLIENCKGKSVETQFNKPSVVRQPNAQRIPKPSVLGKPTPFSNSPEMRSFQMKQSVNKTNVSDGLFKQVTQQNLPQIRKQAVRNTNVIAPGPSRNYLKRMLSVQSPKNFGNHNGRFCSNVHLRWIPQKVNQTLARGKACSKDKGSDMTTLTRFLPKTTWCSFSRKTDSFTKRLEILFSPLLEEYYNPTQSAGKTTMIKHRNAYFKKDEFINPFCTRWYKKLLCLLTATLIYRCAFHFNHKFMITDGPEIIH